MSCLDYMRSDIPLVNDEDDPQPNHELFVATASQVEAKESLIVEFQYDRNKQQDDGCVFKSAEDFKPGPAAEANIYCLAVNDQNGQNHETYSIGHDQADCPDMGPMYKFKINGVLPDKEAEANKLVTNSNQF